MTSEKIDIPFIDTTDVRRILAEVTPEIGTPEYCFRGLASISQMCDFFERMNKK